MAGISVEVAIIKNSEKGYGVSFFPSDKEGFGFTYAKHVGVDSPKRAFLNIIIAAGFLGVVSILFFTPPEDVADEYAEGQDNGAVVASVSELDAAFLTMASSHVDEIKQDSVIPSFVSNTLSALTASKPSEPAILGSEGKNITTESHTITLTAKPSLKSQEITATIPKGGNFVSLMRQNGASNVEANRIAVVLGKIYDLKRVYPGQVVSIVKDDGIASVTIMDRKYNKFSAVRGENGEFIPLTADAKIEVRKSTVNGVITSSFADTADEVGMPKSVAVQFSRAFNDVVNFKTDVRAKDSFEAVFEEQFNDVGDSVGDAKLLYASLKVQGKVYNRYYYKNANGAWGYYDEQGNSQRQAINVWPVGSARVTSRFGSRRHPILMYVIHHSGVDYAVTVGSPVAAAADGKIVYIGTKGGYGKYVRIQHEQGYSTAYAHLNSYNRNLKIGSFVKQGDIIAYSGNTGRSTGPHLHFEVIKDGEKINPLANRTYYVFNKLKGNDFTKFALAVSKVRPSVSYAENKRNETEGQTKTR